jgi:amino acid adenylation domain-containing protein/thioester reductase-like protein
MNRIDRKLHPLTRPQLRELITEKTIPGTPFANCPLSVSMANPDYVVLERAIHRTLARHEGVRLRLVETDDDFRQYVGAYHERTLDFFDFSSDFGRDRWNAWVQAAIGTPFRLDDADLYHVALVKHAPDRGGFYINVHHALVDGGAMKLLIDDILADYRAILGLAAEDDRPRPSYLEFIDTERAYMASEQAKADRDFWLQRLDGLTEETQLPFARSRKTGIAADYTVVEIPADQASRIVEGCTRMGTSFYRLMLSVFYAYVARVSGQSDLVMGALTHNRSTARERATVGMYVNAFPLRIQVDVTEPFAALLHRIDTDVRDILKHHGRYPYDQLASDLRQKTGRIPNLLNLIVVGQDFSADGAELTYHHPGFEQPPFHVILNVVTYGSGRLSLYFLTPVGMFAREDLDRIASHLLRMTDAVLAAPDTAPVDIDLVGDDERHLLLETFNDTRADYPTDASVVELFRQQAAKTPEHPALVFGETSLTYRELDRQSDAIAARLRSLGAGPDRIVGIVAAPSIERIVGVWGAIKAGAAYMPVDTRYPMERVRFMFEDSQAVALLTQRALSEQTAFFAGPVLFLDEPLPCEAEDLPAGGPRPEHLAYIIYTSGSTRKPKGVMIEHRALLNEVLWYTDNHRLTAADRMTHFASFGFDVSINEIFPSLVAGATLHILPDEVKLSLARLSEYYEAHGITCSFLPTQYGEQFMLAHDSRSLAQLDVAGEKLQQFKKRRYALFNGYGPTEFTVYSTFFDVKEPSDNIPIGRPLANCQAYVVDEKDRLVPVGVIGELCLAGANLSRGYLNRPDLTAQRFVDNPFRPGTKMYRTGDLVRWLPDGNLEFQGRKDFQVKIRGFRIELGEIERLMRECPGVRQAVVIDRQDPTGARSLAGYFVADAAVSPSAIRDVLAHELPDYMVPQALIRLDAIPLNPSGKTDRKALPEPVLATALTPPANGTEEALVGMWKEILGLEQVGTTDDFFQIGGHSLKAVQLQSKISMAFQVDVSFRDVLKARTIQALAAILQNAQKVRLATIEPQPAADAYPMTPAQRRVYFVEQLETTGTTYNIPVLIELEGALDEGRLRRAVDALVDRHESLRSRFDIVDGVPVQKVDRAVKYKAVLEDCPEAEVDGRVAAFVQPFAMDKAPLFRVKLLRLSATRHVLVWDLHHTVFDGSSIPILMRELMALYGGGHLPPLRIQYRDYAAWHEKVLESPLMRDQERFWLSMFPDSVPVLDLPTDFRRPTFLSHDGHKIYYRLDDALTARLKRLAREQEVTLYVVLLCAYSVLFAKYSGQDDLVVGTGAAGRTHVDVQDLIGMFVATLPIRSFPADDKPIRQYLREVHDIFLSAFENQDYPFEQLVEKLKVRRDSSRSPLFDVGLVYQSMGFPSVSADGVEARLRRYTHRIAHVDVMLEVLDDGEGLVLGWEYRTALFREDTIERMVRHFGRILESFAGNVDAAVKEIDILPPGEQQQLLVDFNETSADWPREKTVHQIIEEMVEQFPDRLAVSCDEVSLTYRELNERANRLARTLRDRGVKPDTLVGILMDRSVDMIVATLGVLKSGGAYLPILPEYPKDRILFMLENSGAPILLTTERFHEVVAEYAGLRLDPLGAEFQDGDAANLPHVNTPADLIYTIYTSGSTGRPKGVMLEHRNIVRLFINSRLEYDLSERDVWSLFHSFSFDFSVWEIFGALLYGGRIVIVPKRVTLDPALFVDLVRREQVTVLSQTPGAFYNFIDAELKRPDKGCAIRYVTFGGEALKPGLLKAWYERYPETKLINMYGITETTVHVTWKEIGAYEIEHNISNIGVPIPTLTTYIMDRHMRLLPIGVPGEICVGGDGLARGYLGLPEKTAERFVENPYVPGERLYRSGDLARMLPNGEMEYLGRIDFQVKVRGFRIELGEIENRLMAHAAVEKAVVLAVDEKGGGGKVLVGYYVAKKEIPISELRTHLHEALPEYMVPSYFVRMSAFPLTVNGKVDRRALPEPQPAADEARAVVEASSDAEKTMLPIWRRVLGVETLSVTDDFFSLGGHSLKAVSLVSALQKHFDVTVNDVFEHRTLRDLAAHVTPKAQDSREKVFRVEAIMAAREARQAAYMARPEVQSEIDAYNAALPAIDHADVSEHRPYRSVLLTGATGYLGVYVLRDLLVEKSVRVTAVVRASNDVRARARVAEKTDYYFGPGFLDKWGDRLSIVAGDLGKERLGLDASTYDRLAGDVDAVLHTAALVKHYGHYAEFYESNVQAVKNLIGFARAGRPKDLHHVSTLSVAEGACPGDGHVLLTEDVLDRGQRSSNYYIGTKFEAEQEVLQARAEGLNACIYRVGNISLHSRTGLLQKNIEENAFFLMLKAFINLGAMPDADDLVEFSFADQLSRAIVCLYDRTALVSRTFHLWNTHLVRLSELVRDPALDVRVDVMPLARFVQFVYDNYDQPGFREPIEAIMLHKGWLTDIAVEDEAQISTGFSILSDRTVRTLARAGFEWPALEPATLEPMVVAALGERLKFLGATDLLRTVSAPALASLARAGRLEHARDGAELAWAGEPGRGFYVIRDGHVELSVPFESGWVGTVGVLGPGDYFGEEQIVAGRPSGVTVEAVLGDATLLHLDAEDMRRLVLSSPQLGLAMVGDLTTRIHKLRRMVTAMA